MQPPEINDNIALTSRQRFHMSVPSILIYFAGIVFLFTLANAIFSYYIPIYIEANVSGPLVLGLILSFNSVVGFVADVFIGEWLSNRRFTFFLRWMIAVALSYPIALLLLPAHPLILTIAVGVWGIYFELLSFAEYQFIHVYTSRSQHAQAWGLISIFTAIAYTLGPIISSNLIDQDSQAPFVMTIAIILIGTLALTVFFHAHRRRHAEVFNLKSPQKKSVIHQLRIWRILYSRMWHLLLFIASLAIVDNNFWSIGTLLSEQLPKEYNHGLLLALYEIPSLFMGLLAGRVASIHGKKQAAFICGLIAGVILIYTGLTPSVPAMMISVFCCGSFLSIAWPEVNAVMEDFVCRLGKNSNELIAMQNSHLNLAFIVGPVLSGAIAAWVGNQASFSVMGVLLVVMSLFALFSVPRKIRLPQEQLTKFVSI